jgi:hypothetical protein
MVSDGPPASAGPANPDRIRIPVEQPTEAALTTDAAAGSLASPGLNGPGGVGNPVDQSNGTSLPTGVSDPTAVADAPRASFGSIDPDGIGNFVDQSNGTFLTMAVEPSSPLLGRFQLAIDGVGLIWPDQPASHLGTSGSVLSFAYSGGATVDKSATIDLLWGLHQPSGSEEVTTLDLSVNVDIATGDAFVTAVFESTSHTLNSSAPLPETADLVLAEIAERYAVMDWGALYDLGFSGLHTAISRNDFIDAATSAHVAQGAVVVSALPVGRVSYPSGSYVRMAAGDLDVVIADASSTVVVRTHVSLIFEGQQWRLVTLDPEPPTPLPDVDAVAGSS